MAKDIVRWIFVAEGILFCILGMPMALGKVPPNSTYGFRTRKTLSRPEVWYAANRSMGIDLVVAGAVMAIAAVLIAIVFRDRPMRDIALINLAVMIVVLLIVMIKGFFELRQF